MTRRSEHSLQELKVMVLDAAEAIVIKEGFRVFANMADLIMHINARTLDTIAVQLEQVQETNVEHSIETLAMIYLRYWASRI